MIRFADENVNRVLYRENQDLAIGHGCGADWISGRPQRDDGGRMSLLVFETPAKAQIPDQGPRGRSQSLRVSMRLLAFSRDDGLGDADRLPQEYERAECCA